MKKYFLLPAMLLLGACGHWHTSNVDSDKKANGVYCRPADSIVVTEHTIQPPHVVLQDIEVNVRKANILEDDPSRELADEFLREAAHELCADAVVQARYGSVGVSMLSWGEMQARGRAVRLK